MRHPLFLALLALALLGVVTVPARAQTTDTGEAPAGKAPATAEAPAGAVPAIAPPAGAVPAEAAPAGAPPAGAVPARVGPARVVPAGAVPARVDLAGVALAGQAGGGLPRTAIEALQLGLLGLVLLLAGARLRVLALRRRRRAPDLGWSDVEPESDEPPPDPVRGGRAALRDEWAFPDPSEPAPTGLLPSTASARRRARSMAATAARD